MIHVAIQLIPHILQLLGFGVLVLLVVATVIANLLSGSIHNDLNKPRPPKQPKFQSRTTKHFNKRI